MINRKFIKSEINNNGFAGFNLSRSKIKTLLENIDKQLYDEFFGENSGSFYAKMRKYLRRILTPGDIIRVSEKNLNHRFDYEVGNKYRIIEHINLEHQPSRLTPALVCYTKKENNNEFVKIPLNDIDWDLIVLSLAENNLNDDFIYEILANDFTFQDVNLNQDLSFSFEVEGGFNSPHYESDLIDDFNRNGLALVHDGSVVVDADLDSKEIKLEDYGVGNEIFDYIESMNELNDKHNFISNDTCGIHIHVGNIHDFNNNEILKISKLFSIAEKYIYRLLPIDRMTGEYSEPLIRKNRNFYQFISQSNRILEQLSDNVDRELLATAWYNSDDTQYRAENQYDGSRYSAFNLHSLFYRGTIEFRYFDCNTEKLPFYIDLIDSLVTYALNHNLNEIKTLVDDFKYDFINYLDQKTTISNSSIDIFENDLNNKNIDEYDEVLEDSLESYKRFISAI